MSGRPLRVVVGGISHETNTFAPGVTTLEEFRRRSYLSGETMVRAGRGARHVLGGVVDAAEARGMTLRPTLFASAMPGGTVERGTWESLRGRLADRLRARALDPWGIDGVVLVLHGAMAAEGEDDPEGALLRDARAMVGADVPVVAVLDFHANVSAAMIEAADLLVAYRTYPHVDTYERGAEAIERLVELRTGRLRPATAFRLLPLLAPLPPQATIGPTPMREVAALAEEFRAEPGVAAVTIAGGFPYADLPGAGVSVWVTSAGDEPLAAAVADGMAAALWDRRERFQTRGVGPDDAIDRALGVATPGRPVVLAEIADNPGAGGAGDDTTLLERLLARGVSGAAVGALFDPDAVARAHEVGAGGTARFRLGGRSPWARTPLAASARVVRLTDGAFTNRGPIGMGGPTRLGRTAVLRIDGVEVVVCERRQPTLDPELFRSVGIEPTARRMLAVKSSVHFRAAFGPLAVEIIEVETPGLSPSELAALPYRRVRRPIFPLDREVRYLD